jgi:transposase
MRRPGDIWTEKEEARLRKMATMGITRTEAARRLGRHASTVSEHIRLAGLEWKSPRARRRPSKRAAGKKMVRYWTQEEHLKLEELAATGMGIGRAAMEIDRDLAATWRKARSWGIKFRGQPQKRQAPRR